MKILFTTKYTTSPSTELNAGKLQHLNAIDGVHIDFYNTHYADYDVVLFMGYDPDIEAARAARSSLKIGVIDPRPQFGPERQPLDADFLLVNGIEMKDWYRQYRQNIFTYYIYPELQRTLKPHRASEKIVLGYHGNKDHLQEMFPRITEALEQLAQDYKVELWAMYNIDHLQKWECPAFEQGNVSVRHLQWSEENYERYISQVDIGLIPNLTPVNDDVKKRVIPPPATEAPPQQRRSVLQRFFHASPKNLPKEPPVPSYREHETDYLVRYKATSNPGRIFVFAQYGVPVVADMFPSSLQLIDDGVDGFVCYSTGAWYWALKQLADHPDLRTAFAQKMLTKFDNIAAPDVLNTRLVQFIKDI